ncbi:MAG: ATP-binding cassette domain-containing protein [Propionibacteriaceae bacterium]
MTAAIEVRDLRKAYPAHVAVDGLTMSVAQGSVFGFLGPNGAGKTTTVRMLLGFARPTSGTIAVLGQTISGAHDAELAHLRGRIGFLPDVPGFYPWMRAADVLQFAGSLVGVRGSTMRSRTDDLLGLAGLTDVRQKVGSYSRGMRQRLGIAQALVGAPDLLVLDEPTSALDPIGRKGVLDMVSALRGRATVFFSTHILSDVERVCDEVAILDQGRLVTQGTVEDLRKRYGGSMRYALDVDADTPRVVDALAAESWAGRVTLTETGLDVVVDDLVLARRRVPVLIAQLGVGLVRFEQIETSLEDVFVSLVEHAA